MPKKILLTGFEPFLSHSENPSGILVADFKSFDEFDCHASVLPVSYAKAPEKLMNILNQEKWDGVISLGLSAASDKINLERVALNWQESSFPDNDQKRPQTGPIDQKSSPAFFNPLNLEIIKNQLISQEIPVQISWSAGAYVCNRLYFDLLQYCETRNIPALFVHIPLFDIISKDKQSQALKIILRSSF